MTKKSYLFSAFLVLLGLWWGWTFLVDVFVVRTVFGIVDDFFLAGDVGIAVFSKLNNLEVFVGSSLVTVVTLVTRKNKKAFPLLILTLAVWLIAMVYIGFLTPKLIILTELWKQSELTGISSAALPDLQQEHQFYHNLYIAMDSVKLLLLSALLFLGIWKEEKLF